VSTASSTTAPLPTDVQKNLDSVLSDREQPSPPSALSASVTLAWRATLKMKNALAEQLFDVVMMPVLFLLIFQYLLGGAVAGSSADYLQYFLPGVLVMSAIMQTTGTTLNTDIVKGIFDRFRTMPFWQPASLVGTVLADLGRYIVALLLCAALGLALGFRPEAGAVGFTLAILLLSLFAFAFAWIFTALGMYVKKTETMHNSSMILMAMVFCSNIFASSDQMPGWMRAVVDINPISHAATAARGLMHGTATAGQILLVLLSSSVLVVIFGPLTMWLYRRRKSS
jgi:ABC-2 type transport system permease protein